MAPFTNNARSDGLVLRHWQRQQEPAKPAAPEGSEMEVDGEKKEEVEPKLQEPEYSFAKYNIKARVPRRYTDDEYNQRLKSDEWTRQETDYLMDLVEEYDLRWVVIADRYDYEPQEIDTEANATALVPAKRYRTMEQMKARYYQVAATMLAIEHPPSEMSEAEFDLHEKMLKFNPERERSRKELAALQLNRTSDEVREEGMLLEELKRITANEQNFITDRRELYSRLEAPISVGNTTMYQSSQGLSQLLQTLLQADKSKKRRSLLGLEGTAPSPGGPNMPTRDGRADTPSNYPPGTKKSTMAAAAAAREAQQTIKTLTPAEEARYGVQRHERLTASVQFRSDRAQKLTQAKSNVQTQKLAAALAELEVPLRLLMPTERVCKEFEKLIHSVNLLLDARKVSEKVESEIRVLTAAKEERERKEREAAGGVGQEEVKQEVDESQALPPAAPAPASASAPDPEPEPEAEAGPEAASAPSTETPGRAAATNEPAPVAENEVKDKAPARDAPPTEQATDPSTAESSHKRSASVLSNGSDKSSKRQRK